MKAGRKEFCGKGKKIDQGLMDNLDHKIEQAKTAGDRSRKKTLKRELDFPSFLYLPNLLKFRRQRFLLIGARNDYVRKGLQRAYSDKVPGGNMEIFCVSNVAYEKFSKKGTDEYVVASGIPELRRLCHTVTAKSQFLEAKHLLQSRLPSLLSSIRLWVESGQARLSSFDREEARKQLLDAMIALTEKVCS